ncbi:hypothetical protein GUJ93_ZPchr0008g12480 [Zizania palustris]|uniref:Uncharacterized protein n=1 Tax=Zizania palustris TaxID=103762 RepID=A0A8J5RHR1_ZIZPA|nr:hypothetical protein GUJ93_ZPchr0008g12480 [Zizania palustris]
MRKMNRWAQGRQQGAGLGLRFSMAMRGTLISFAPVTVVNTVEASHFELREDPSFWMENNVKASNTPFEVLVRRYFTAPKSGFARSKSSKPRRLRSTHNPEDSVLLSQCRLRTLGAFEQASHFTLRKSRLPSADFDQILSDNNWC